ncbi:glycosyltransferase family 2 protein, partial [Pseudomonas aeruginosa]|uniref:glycosyltransferase family 2 protein n=1 Tax=Pseudomonas aeruginosa TaxID=287 RepID=UPI003EB955AA
MNMLAERDILLQDNALLDERFVGYGFEDTEFGLRVGKLGYSVLPCRAEIEHVEPEGSISKFCRKYYHAARDGMPEFMKVATTDDLETLG